MPAIPDPLRIPPWPPPDDQVRAALVTAWENGSWGTYHGDNLPRLETAIRDILAIEHVYLCCSGTFAVELALRMLRVGFGDEVILAGYDFPGNFRAILAVGATPVLIDILPQRWHLDVSQLPLARSPKVKAVIASHLHGVVAPLPEIMDVARSEGWAVVEDACQMTGGLVADKPAGTWGDVGVFSFGGSKLLTSGRGGAVVTHDATLLQRAKVFCEQGNHAYPLSELQAAVLLPQVAKLRERNAIRLRAVHRIAERYRSAAPAALQSQLQISVDHGNPAYYKFGWWLRDPAKREHLLTAIQAAGLPLDAGFRGFTRRSSRARAVGNLPHAHHAAAGTLLLHHPILLADDDTLHAFVDQLIAVAQTMLS